MENEGASQDAGEKFRAMICDKDRTIEVRSACRVYSLLT